MRGPSVSMLLLLLLSATLLVGLSACDLLGTPEPTLEPTLDPQAIEEANRLLAGRATATPTPDTPAIPTATPLPTQTPSSTDTPTPIPTPTSPPAPTPAVVSTLAPTATARPIAIPTPIPTATPIPAQAPTLTRSIDEPALMGLLRVGTAVATPGGRVTVPIILDESRGVSVINVNLSYDATKLLNGTGEPGDGFPQNQAFASNLAGPGDLRFIALSFQGATFIPGNQPLFLAKFDMAPGADEVTPIQVALLTILGEDGEALHVEPVSGSVQIP